MNNLDMYTREKANKIHLDEMHQAAHNRRMLRDLEKDGDLQSFAFKRRLYVALAVSALIAVIAFFLVASGTGFLPIV
jgi:hypothetical protein